MDQGGASLEGTQFGRYHVIGSLGRGGMGEVYRAFDAVTEREVALKVLHPAFADNEQYQERFRREARAAAGLDDPHVVPIYDYGDIDGRLYVTMRFITGRDLQKILANGPLSASRAVHIVEQIASALDAAHAKGLVHRDVKPSNILVSQRDFSYLIDFGIARAARDPGMTSTGAVMGTWAYMSPERLNTGQAGPSADVYALTCVLYEALTGQKPFAGESLEQQVVGHLATPPPKPSSNASGLPLGLDAVVAEGLAKNPHERFGTPGRLASAARAALEASDASTPAMKDWSGRRSVRSHTAATQKAPTVDPEPFVEKGSQTVSTGDLDRVRPPTRSVWRRPSTLAAEAVVIVLVIALVLYLWTNATWATGEQSLPLKNLRTPKAVAVDGAGKVYVADANYRANHVVTLAVGSGEQAVLPITGLFEPQAVAANTKGDVVVADPHNNRVVTLAAGATRFTEVRVAEPLEPYYVAIDMAGTVYFAGGGPVYRVPPGASNAEIAPYIDSVSAYGLTCDAAGNLYISTAGGEVLKVESAMPQRRSVVPFTDIFNPRSPAVDANSNVYVIDGGRGKPRIIRVTSWGIQTDLEVKGLSVPEGIAVDSNRKVLYVVDSGNDGGKVLVHDLT